MTEDAIQNKISLIGFRVASFNFTCAPNPTLEEPKDKTFDLKLGNLLHPDEPNIFTKVFYVRLVFDSNEHHEVFRLDMEYHVGFQCATPVDDAFLNGAFGTISAPAIGFPFVRAFISNFTVQAGSTPIILPSINFVQFNKEASKV